MPKSAGGPLLSRIRKETPTVAETGPKPDQIQTKTGPKPDKQKPKKPPGPPKAKEPHGVEYFRNRLVIAHGKMIEAAKNVADNKPRSKLICEMEPVIASYLGRRQWLEQNFDAEGNKITPAVVEKLQRDPWKRIWPKEGDNTFAEQRAKYDTLKDIAYRSICSIVADPESLEVIEVARKAVARFNEFRFIHKRQWTRNGEWYPAIKAARRWKAKPESETPENPQ